MLTDAPYLLPALLIAAALAVAALWIVLDRCRTLRTRLTELLTTPGLPR